MKKTIFGAILAAFLVMSVSFIAPVHVKAAEADLKNNLSELATIIAEDPNLVELVDNSPALDALLDAVKTADEETVNNPTQNQEFMDKVYAVLELDQFNDLVEKCSPYLDEQGSKSIIDDIKNLDEKKGTLSTDFYKITFDKNDVVKVTKQDKAETSEEDAVVLSSNGEIITKEFGTLLDGDDLTIFELIFLILIGLGVIIGAPLLIVLGLLLIFEFLAAIVGSIVTILSTILEKLIIIIVIPVALAVVDAIVGFIANLLPKLLDFLNGIKEGKSKANINNKSTFERIIENFKALLTRVLSMFNANLNGMFA